LSPYELVMFYYYKLAEGFQYTPCQIDETDLETMFDMLYVGTLIRDREKKKEEKPKKVYIDEIF